MLGPVLCHLIQLKHIRRNIRVRRHSRACYCIDITRRISMWHRRLTVLDAGTAIRLFSFLNSWCDAEPLVNTWTFDNERAIWGLLLR
jgi:hypothetical protein